MKEKIENWASKNIGYEWKVCGQQHKDGFHYYQLFVEAGREFELTELIKLKKLTGLYIDICSVHENELGWCTLIDIYGDL